MRVALINPAFEGKWVQIHPLEETLPVYAGGISPPLGLLYVATVLAREGTDVIFLDNDVQRMSVEETVKRLNKEDLDIAGFSIQVESCFNAHETARKLKELNPNVKILYGGPLTTTYPERLMRKYDFVDFLIRGEGEYATLNLVQTLERNGDLSSVKGLAYREGGKVRFNPPSPLIENLDELPFPDRKLLGAQYDAVLPLEDFIAKFCVGKYTSLLSSRGCPYTCRFCYTGSLGKGIWRCRSPQNVVDELEMLDCEGYGHVYFVDDNFAVDERRVVEICRLIRQRGLDLYWSVETSVKNLSGNMVKEMKSAGCEAILFGIESGSQKILDYYGKPITPNESALAVRKARKAGISAIVGTFILGAPIETREEIRATLKFARSIDLDGAIFFPLMVIPMTSIWHELKEQGYLTQGLEEQYWEHSKYVWDILHTNVEKSELLSLMEEGYEKFFWKPDFVPKLIIRNTRHKFRRLWAARNLSSVPALAKSILITRIRRFKQSHRKPLA